MCDLFTTLEKNDFASCPDGNTHFESKATPEN